MAGFGTRDSDEATFAARWRAAFAEPRSVLRAVVEGHEVIGFAAVFLRDGNPEVTYGIARSHWGRGVATLAALFALLGEVKERPIRASTAADNVASLRVLARCGFTVCGTGRAFANARGEEIDETFLVLERPGAERCEALARRALPVPSGSLHGRVALHEEGVEPD